MTHLYYLDYTFFIFPLKTVSYRWKTPLYKDSTQSFKTAMHLLIMFLCILRNTHDCIFCSKGWNVTLLWSMLTWTELRFSTCPTSPAYLRHVIDILASDNFCCSNILTLSISSWVLAYISMQIGSAVTNAGVSTRICSEIKNRITL